MNLGKRWVILIFIITMLSLNPRYTPIITDIDGKPDYASTDLEFSLPNNYTIEEYGNSTNDGYYNTQVKEYYCGPACVLMVLNYLVFKPGPSQALLAEELNTDFYESTMDVDMPTSFRNRGFDVLDSTHDSFEEGWDEILESIYQNHSVIVLMWFSSLKRYGHYVVVIGYNQTGLFIHDPWPSTAIDRECGPNVYLPKSLFEILWEYDDFWSMIIPYQPGLRLNIDLAPEHTSIDIITVNVTAFNDGQKVTGSDVSVRASISSNDHYIMNLEEALLLVDDGNGNFIGNYQIQYDDMISFEDENWNIYVNMISGHLVGSTNSTTQVSYSSTYMIFIGSLIGTATGVLILSVIWIRKRRIQRPT